MIQQPRASSPIASSPASRSPAARTLARRPTSLCTAAHDRSESSRHPCRSDPSRPPAEIADLLLPLPRTPVPTSDPPSSSPRRRTARVQILDPLFSISAATSPDSVALSRSATATSFLPQPPAADYPRLPSRPARPDRIRASAPSSTAPGLAPISDLPLYQTSPWRQQPSHGTVVQTHVLLAGNRTQQQPSHELHDIGRVLIASSCLLAGLSSLSMFIGMRDNSRSSIQLLLSPLQGSSP